MKQGTIINEELQNAEKKDQKTFLKIIEKLKENYFKEYGSQRNVLGFFQNFVSVDNQIKLIKSLRIGNTNVIQNFHTQNLRLVPFPETIEEDSKRTNLPIEEMMMPYCYNWQKCFVHLEECGSSESCGLRCNNKSFLEEE